MITAIETFALTKNFISTNGCVSFYGQGKNFNLAITNINLQIKRGELFCLLGPNGAGKSTLIKILACLILPTVGTAKICGHDILKEENKVKSSVGLISGDERGFYGRLTLRQNLDFFAALYNLSVAQAKSKIGELSRLLGISGQLHKQFQESSSGIKQRLALMRGLLNDPAVLLMDEPLRSLDYCTRINLMGFIKEKLVREQGKTILFATHNISEVEGFASRIAIMHNSEIRVCGTLEELRHKIGSLSASLEEIYTVFLTKGRTDVF
jgi:ABC-2 type transport system ATP-binding protein